MYICNDPVCDPVCDFCWFCKHDENGVPKCCTKGKIEEFDDGLGYCDEFKCRIHEKQPQCGS
ncbi:hypothetical protein [Acetivibrio saccincola]|uniref:Uncharacterized protein n=1 Tax=Acetivibrio saccincola TaxID=1677857 RepID=A0A2S8R9J9_9FIRM|nr:hypothetical protein [Acetivibrio saccincola]PQQ66460.1 hypothetical protein B9R14_06635 [Acetivibrio saccincola]